MSSQYLNAFFDAAKSNHLDKVDDILQSHKIGVNARSADEKNNTALHLAAFHGYEKLARMLVDNHNADVNAVNDYGLIPLEIAKDKYHTKICKFLIDRNSEKAECAKGLLNSKDVDEFFEAAEANNLKKVSQMIDNKRVHVDSVDKGGYNSTALHVACRHGFEKLARTLVDKYNADVNKTDDIGDRPIHVAAQNDHINLMNFLVERKSVDVDHVKDYLK